MKGIALALVLAFGLAGSAARSADLTLKWEYRVMTRSQLLDLGNKDLAAGLNKLGDDGWELLAVKDEYIFKRLKSRFSSREKRDLTQRQMETIKGRIGILESAVEMQKDRVAWTQRMVKKGFLAASSIQAEKLELQRAQLCLDEAVKDLKALVPDPAEAAAKKPKADK